MSNRALYIWGAGIALLALTVCILVPWRIGVHTPEHGYLIAYGLSAAGTFTAAAVAVLVATNDIRARREERRQERDEADETQARLVIVQPSIDVNNPLRTEIVAVVSNFGTLAILDVVLIKLEALGHGPGSKARTTIPAIPPNQQSELRRSFPRGSVPQNAEITATIQFTDANSNWWEVTFRGPAISQVQFGKVYSSRRISFQRITAELGHSRLPGGSRWEEILDGAREVEASQATETGGGEQ